MLIRQIAMFVSGLALATAAHGAPAPKTYPSWSVFASIKEPTGTSGTAAITPALGKISFATPNTEYTITAATGYDIKSVLMDGRAVSVPNPDSRKITFDNTRLLHTLVVTTIPEKYHVATAVSPPRKGAFSPASVKNIPYGTEKTVRITPAKGYQIMSITETPTDKNGNPTGAATNIPITNNQEMRITYKNTSGYRKLTASFDLRRAVNAIISPAGDRTLDVSNGPVMLRLDGTPSTSAIKPVTYSWKLDGATDPGEAALTADPVKNDPTIRIFTAKKTGVYTATLTVSDGVLSGTAAVKITVQAVNIGKSASCITCHGAETSRVSGQQIGPSYEASGHSRSGTGPTCSSCHGDHVSGITRFPYDSCSKCHNGSASPAFGAIEHFTGGTASGTAGYVGASGAAGTKVSCSACHFDVDAHGVGADAETLAAFRKYAQKLAEWASSGHGDRLSTAWTSDGTHNWKREGTSGAAPSGVSGGDCVRCHTPQGFAAYLKSGYTSIAPWGDAGDLSSFTLNCSACHADDSRGGTTTALRPATQYTAWFNTKIGSKLVPLSYQYPDVETSNLCLPCHTGRTTGDTIKAAAATGANFGDLGFISPHNLSAAGTIFRTSGYHFDGQDYANNSHFQHDRIGEGDGKGPCVSCHMGNSKNHSWKIATRDEAGTVTSVSSAGCVDCHGTMPATMLQGGRSRLFAATSALKAVLQAKGIYYSSAYPYFFRSAGDTSTANAFRNWDSVYPGRGRDVMGAAFNLNLALHEPGMYAHNRLYAAKLLQDSIDFIDDGAINDSANATILSVPGLTGEQRANATNFLAVAGGNNCMSCHTAASSKSIEKPKHIADVNVGSNFTDPAFKGYTAIGKRSAQYLAANSACSDCHNGFNVSDQARQWSASGKGDVTAKAYTYYDFKTRGAAGATAATSASSDCVRCHTTTGYVNYIATGSIAPFADGAADKTLEVLQCNVCHYSPVDDNGARREVPAATAYYNYSSTELSTQKGVKRVLVSQQYPNVGTSNICVTCHVGRQSGKTIQAVAATGVNFGSLPFINSHYLTAGGTVFGKTGYQFSGKNYDRPLTFAHDSIGEDEGQGPCVGCHMSSTDKHSFSPMTKDASGNITAVKSGVCTNCHSMSAATVNAKKQEYDAALEALAGALQTKGIYFADTNPYFFRDTNGNGTLEAAETTRNNSFKEWGGADTMGAAFNYNLLRHEPGAFTHNSVYVRRLIADSVATLTAKGTVAAAIDAVVAAGKLDAGKGVIAKGYLAGVRP